MINRIFITTILVILSISLVAKAQGDGFSKKLSPDKIIEILKEGNERFYSHRMNHPNLGKERLIQAGSESQSDYAFATVLACSDSRVPVESIFDTGIMDVFVVRVAGNVCNKNELGTIEYGLAHVYTPVLVVMGHSLCGAVTAATQVLDGHAHNLERNIPSLIKGIIPAVENTLRENSSLSGTDLIARSIESNVWLSIQNLFLKSPAARRLVKEGKVKVVGAIYDVGSGVVNWLPENEVLNLLNFAENSPEREEEEFAH